MIILGVDTTAVIGSVAVCEIENKELKSHVVFTVKNKLTHSETLLPMIDATLKTYGVDIDKVEILVINIVRRLASHKEHSQERSRLVSEHTHI